MQWLENSWMHKQKWLIINVGGGRNEANILLYRGVMKQQGLMCQGTHANNPFCLLWAPQMLHKELAFKPFAIQ